MMSEAQAPAGTAIAHLSEIPEGEGRVVKAGGLHLAVFNTRAGVFVTQATCPHKQGPLADGLTGTNTIMCPLHDRIFDLRTGIGVNTDACIQTYPATLDADGTIMLIAP
jgi:nitrite reductase (NADH) small subunit